MKKKSKRPLKPPTSGDEDSDVERNFALFTEKQTTGTQETRPPEEGEESEDEGSEVSSKEEESNAEEEGSEAVREGPKRLEESDEEAESDEDEAESDEEEAESEGGRKELLSREDVQKELSHMSFEDVLKLQRKVGTKVFNQVKHDGDSKPEPRGKRKRLNKNRPVEVSGKRPVPFLRQVVSVKKSTLRDPRFDDLSGEYKADIFEKTYGFINDIKQRETQLLKKKLKKTKNVRRKEELHFLVQRLENQERARLSREQQRNRELDFKRKQRERANQGQAPLFLKNSERKRLQLLEKYQDLKKSGKLDNFLSKKRKRNAGKDRKRLPTAPPTST